jgi:hypothetical protein
LYRFVFGAVKAESRGDVRKEYGLSSEFEIPMEFFAFTVENALKKNGVHGDRCDWISANQWQDVRGQELISIVDRAQRGFFILWI